MASRKDYENALTQMEEAYFDSDTCLGAMKRFSKNIELFYGLLEEHFDNPPLKFEELKEDMWVWDNKDKRWMCIERIKNVLICMNSYKHYLYANGVPIIFEENRFYRKQVGE